MRKILLLFLLGLSSSSFAEDVEERAAFEFESVCARNNYKLETIKSELLKIQQQRKIADLSRSNICEEVIRIYNNKIYNNKEKKETEIIKILDLLLTSNGIRDLNKKDNSMYLAFYYNCLSVIQYLKEHGFDFKTTQVWDCLLIKERSPDWMKILAGYLCQKEEQEGSNYYKNLFQKINDTILSSDNKKINIDALNSFIYCYSINQADLRYLKFYGILCETYQQKRVPQNSSERNRWWETLCVELSRDVLKKKFLHEDNLKICNAILKDIEEEKIENPNIIRNIHRCINIVKNAIKTYQELCGTLLENLVNLNNLELY